MQSTSIELGNRRSGKFATFTRMSIQKTVTLRLTADAKAHAHDNRPDVVCPAFPLPISVARPERFDGTSPPGADAATPRSPFPIRER